MRALVSVLCAAGLVLVLAACAGGGGSTSGVLGASTAKGGDTTTTASVCRGGTKVRMKVFNGPSGATLALVPVTIDGRGPYVFALDTGAAKSALSRFSSVCVDYGSATLRLGTRNGS